MLEMISVKLSAEQIRLLREVTSIAAIEDGRTAAGTQSKRAQDQYNARAARLNELAEIFKKLCP